MRYRRTVGLIEPTIIYRYLLVLDIGTTDGREPSKTRLSVNALPFFFDIANLRQSIAPTSNDMNAASRIYIDMCDRAYTNRRSRSWRGKH